TAREPLPKEPALPFLTPESTDERDSLATFAKQQIDQVATTLHGLTPEALRPEDTAESLVGALAEVGQQLADAIRAADMDTEGPVPQAPWFEGRTTWTMRWYSLHQIEE